MQRDDSQEGARNIFGVSMVALAAVVAVVGGLIGYGYHVVATAGASDIEKSCGVDIPWWMTLLWALVPFGVVAVFAFLRGLVFKGNTLPILISIALLVGIFGLDHAYMDWYGGSRQTIPSDINPYCKFMRSIFPAK